jgi:hypothetical protein
MKNIILKTPSFVFLIAMYFPWSLFFFVDLPQIKGFFSLLTLFSTVVGAIWIIAVAEYMCSEAKSRKYVALVYGLLAMEFIFQLTEFLLMDYLEANRDLFHVFRILLLIDVIVIGILMTKIIKRVFYARSTYFVFLEASITPIGMWTLTSDIQDWEKGDKK